MEAGRGFRIALAASALLVTVVLTVIGPLGGASAAVGPTDLALTKTDSADPVTVGDTFTYTILVKNQGTGDATDVTVTDPLPSQVSYVSAVPTSGTCLKAGSTVTCTLGQVNAGVTVSITLTVKASSSGTASNTATVTTTVADADGANNQATQTTVISKKPATPKTQKQKKTKGKTCGAPTIIGTEGNDSLTGTHGSDVIASLGGNDTIFGDRGNDLICAGGGADLVSGGSGADTIIGGPGPDALFGNTGDDLLKGKGGRDHLRGNADDDFLNGGFNRDNCRGGSGVNTLRRCP